MTGHHPRGELDTALLGSRVQVWEASVAQLALRLDTLRSVLDTRERQQAARFVLERDRTRYAVAHGVVRLVLARYVDSAPGALEFGAEALGKPYLVSPAGDIAFNLSHSGDAIVVAVARGRAVGVDIEQIVPEMECELVARTAFSPLEQRELRETPEGVRCDAFYQCWARKEAYLKATGAGAAHGLDHFDVTLGTEAALRADRRDATALARWTMKSLAIRPGYAAALVFDGGDAPVDLGHVDPGELIPTRGERSREPGG